MTQIHKITELLGESSHTRVMFEDVVSLVACEQITAAEVPSKRFSYAACKRVTDLVFSALVLVIAAPFMLLIALLIKIDSHGPVLFSQVRVGFKGRPFVCYKFRTMYYEADPEVHRQFVRAFIRGTSQNNARSDSATASTFKLTNDPRITRIGFFLRRSSLDELPQVINVLRGEMSWVGPRPPLPYEADEYQEWHKGRLLAMPGITGLWQVQGRSRVPFDEMVRLDLDYIARQSMWLDFKILLQTIPSVLFAKGAE